MIAMAAEKPMGGMGLAHLWNKLTAWVGANYAPKVHSHNTATTATAGLMSAADKAKLDSFNASVSFDFDNPPGREDLKYSYTEAENPTVYTEYWKSKANGSIYATRTSTANTDETQWTVVTVCEALNVHDTVTWAEQEDDTWKEM